MSSPQQIPLVPLSTDKFSALRDRDDVEEAAGSTPVLGDNFNSPDEVYAYTGFCNKFNLSDSDDRAAYAELSAQLYAGTEYMRLWEERIPVEGDIVVYVSYIQVLRVRKHGNDNFELN